MHKDLKFKSFDALDVVSILVVVICCSFGTSLVQVSCTFGADFWFCFVQFFGAVLVQLWCNFCCSLAAVFCAVLCRFGVV